MRKVTLDDMFKLKKGMKIRLGDDKVIELTSDYDADIVGYKYIEEGGNTEETISSLAIRAGEIL